MIDVRKSKFFFEIKTESKKGLLPIAKMKFVYTMITKKISFGKNLFLWNFSSPISLLLLNQFSFFYVFLPSYEYIFLMDIKCLCGLSEYSRLEKSIFKKPVKMIKK